MGEFVREVLTIVVAAVLTIPTLVLLRQFLLLPCRKWIAYNAPSITEHYRTTARRAWHWRFRMRVLIGLLPLIDKEYQEWKKGVIQENENVWSRMAASCDTNGEMMQPSHYLAFLTVIKQRILMEDWGNGSTEADTFLKELPRDNAVEYPKYERKVHRATEVEFICGLDWDAYRQRIQHGYMNFKPPSYVVQSYVVYLHEHKLYPKEHIATDIGGDSTITQRVFYNFADDGSIKSTVSFHDKPRYRASPKTEAC